MISDTACGVGSVLGCDPPRPMRPRNKVGEAEHTSGYGRSEQDRRPKEGTKSSPWRSQAIRYASYTLLNGEDSIP